MTKILRSGSPAAHLVQFKTKEFIRHVSAELRDYVAAPNAPGREAAIEAARRLFAQFESAKAGTVAQHPRHLGAGLEPDKLDSLARKLAAIPGYSAADAQAFFALVSPPLADRLSHVSTLTAAASLHSAILDYGASFKTGGVTFYISQSALESSRYLSALASGNYAEQPDKRGAIVVSGITAEHLEAVIEFLEENEISDVRRFGQERLLKIAQRFGNDAMESYVQDPQKYRAEQVRLARLEGIEGAAAISASFVRIEAGVFLMGSPADEAYRYDDEVHHTVHLTRPYLFKQTPVTQAEYQALMGRNPSHYAQGPDASSRPVEQVSWYDAVAYCNALSEKEGLPAYYAIQNPPGASNPVVSRSDSAGAEKSYRLPTEAEWEYAARAGSAQATHGPRDEIAWFSDNAGRSTMPVGQKSPNAWGLHDMLGNVGQWTGDVYGPLQGTEARDPQGPDAGASRVIRGGCFCDHAQSLRAAARFYGAPDVGASGIGLRPARSDD